MAAVLGGPAKGERKGGAMDPITEIEVPIAEKPTREVKCVPGGLRFAALNSTGGICAVFAIRESAIWWVKERLMLGSHVLDITTGEKVG